MTSTHPETGSLAQAVSAEAQQDASGAPGQFLPPPQPLLDEIGNAVAASELGDPRWLVERADVRLGGRAWGDRRAHAVAPLAAATGPVSQS